MKTKETIRNVVNNRSAPLDLLDSLRSAVERRIHEERKKEQKKETRRRIKKEERKKETRSGKRKEERKMEFAELAEKA